MIPFAPIQARALARIGAAELQRRLPEVKIAAALEAIPDDRYLSDLVRRIFRAGLKHSLVDAKWPAFEEVFAGFVPNAVTAMADEAIERLMGDARLIRHWGKLRSVRDNAAAFVAIAAEHGSFGRYIARWPCERIVELWADLARRCGQMGGDSAPRFLRMVGKDSFVLTPSVVTVLGEAGIAGNSTGKAMRAQAQAQFNQWAAETGLPLSHLSMIAAASVDEEGHT